MPKEAGPLYNRGVINIRLALAGLLDQAGAITFLASVVPGFVLSFEKMLYIPDVAGAGVGASQVLRLRKGGAAGTIIDTITLTLANHVLGGAGVASTGVTAANESIARLQDTDGFSITKDAGGVVF